MLLKVLQNFMIVELGMSVLMKTKTLLYLRASNPRQL